MRWLRRGLLALLALGAAGCVRPGRPAAVARRGRDGPRRGRRRAGPRAARGRPGAQRSPDARRQRPGQWPGQPLAVRRHPPAQPRPLRGEPGHRPDRGTATLPSRLVINPGDVAAGARAVWVAVGASLYRIVPGESGSAVTRPFATLPHGGLIGDVVTSPGAVWVDDTTRGTVYRYPASRTARPDSAVTIGRTAGAMAAGDGGVWVADPDTSTVSRISPARAPGQRGRPHAGPGHPPHHGPPQPLAHRRHGRRHRGRRRRPHPHHPGRRRAHRPGHRRWFGLGGQYRGRHPHPRRPRPGHGHGHGPGRRTPLRGRGQPPGHLGRRPRPARQDAPARPRSQPAAPSAGCSGCAARLGG